MANKKIIYAEPKEYFPKEVRKKLKLGEYATKTTTTKKKVKRG